MYIAYIYVYMDIWIYEYMDIWIYHVCIICVCIYVYNYIID